MQVTWLLNGETVVRHQIPKRKQSQTQEKNEFYFSSEDEEAQQKFNLSDHSSQSDSVELPEYQEDDVYDKKVVVNNNKKRKRNKKQQKQQKQQKLEEESESSEEEISIQVQKNPVNDNMRRLTSRQQAILLKQQTQDVKENQVQEKKPSTKRKGSQNNLKITISFNLESPSEEQQTNSPSLSIQQNSQTQLPQQVPSEEQVQIEEQVQSEEQIPNQEQIQQKKPRRKEVSTTKIIDQTKETIERVLREQGRKLKKIKDARNGEESNGKISRRQIIKIRDPCFVYKSTAKSTYINIPPQVNFNFLLNQKSIIYNNSGKTNGFSKYNEESKSCCVCGEMKKYKCSKTNKFVCSLECYKNNLLQNA